MQNDKIYLLNILKFWAKSPENEISLRYRKLCPWDKVHNNYLTKCFPNNIENILSYH